MIKVKGRIVTFTGKDAIWLKRESKALGLSQQDFFTGMIWEALMRSAREGAFLEKAKKS
jgi:hypothetical protein